MNNKNNAKRLKTSSLRAEKPHQFMGELKHPKLWVFPNKKVVH